MAFTLSSENLPKYVKLLPSSLQLKWITIYNKFLTEQGEKAALVAANAWLKKQVGVTPKKEPKKNKYKHSNSHSTKVASSLNVAMMTNCTSVLHYKTFMLTKTVLHGTLHY